MKITHTLMPDYYPSFRCAANECRYTCCQDWIINFNKKDYLTLKQAPQSPALKALMAQSLQRIRGEKASEENYAKIKLDENGYCPLINKDGLCSLQLECGGDTLPKVCRVFPRREALSPNGTVECSCSTGCEEVVRLLLEAKDGLSFTKTTIVPKEVSLPNPSGFNRAFAPIREMCIDILQERSHTLPHRMLLLGMALQDLNKRPAEQVDEWLEDWLSRSRVLLEDAGVRAALADLLGNKIKFLINSINQIAVFSTPDKQFADVKNEVLAILDVKPYQEETQINLASYIDAEDSFLKSYGDMEYFFENLMVNVFFYMQYPLCTNAKEIWTSYLNFCNLYSLLRFTTICGCAKEPTKNRLIHVLTIFSRIFLHDGGLQSFLGHKYEQNESTSLAHIAVLVCG